MLTQSLAPFQIRKIAKIVRSSPQRMELFKSMAEHIEEYNERKALEKNQRYVRKPIKNLVLDVVTRWNSVFFMLERALEFSEVCQFRCYSCLL